MNFLSGEINLPSAESSRTGGNSLPNNEITSAEITMLEFLSKKRELLVKSQQRNEPDLTSEEKLDALRSILESNPALFLARFGQYLDLIHLKCFEHRRKGNYDINFHLQELEHSLSSAAKKAKAKNRRYEALQRLVDNTDYFTEEEMQRRNPILYEQLIGRYHSKEERAAFLQQSSMSTSGAHATPLADMLMAHMDRNDGEISNRRKDQEGQLDQETAADEEYDDQMEEDNSDLDTDMASSKARKADDSDGEGEEIEEDEKELLKEEFFTTMYRSFLEGQDKDFDYLTVDENPEYDVGETLEQDEEDKYFEAEEPCEVDPLDDMQSTLVLDDSFKYPTHNKEPEQNISESTKISSQYNGSEDDEEDELDRYMKCIEKELK